MLFGIHQVIHTHTDQPFIIHFQILLLILHILFLLPQKMVISSDMLPWFMRMVHLEELNRMQRRLSEKQTLMKFIIYLRLHVLKLNMKICQELLMPILAPPVNYMDLFSR